MPASAGRPGPQAIAHPWQTAGIFAVIDLAGFLVMSATHGGVDAKAISIAGGSAVVVFVLVAGLLFGYRVAARS